MGTSADPARVGRVHDAIVRVCRSGHRPRRLFAEVAARLRTVVPFHAAGWLETDPATLLYTGAVIENVPPPAHVALFENELLGSDVARFAELLRRPVPVARLLDETGGAPERSQRQRAIYGPLGLGDELRAVFVAGGACWGVACLTRAADQPPFSAEDAAFVAGLCPHVGVGLRAGMVLREAEAAAGEADAPGMVVLDAGMTVEWATASGERWLAALPRDDRAGAGLELPSVVYGVAARARGAGGDAPRARVRTADGRWLVIHASRLRGRGGGEDRVAVVLEPARRAEVAPLLVAAHDLSEREREVTTMLLRGLSTEEIARSLVISRHTVRDHVKAIYAKLMVSSRPELTARLMDEAPPAEVVQLPAPGD